MFIYGFKWFSRKYVLKCLSEFIEYPIFNSLHILINSLQILYLIHWIFILDFWPKVFEKISGYMKYQGQLITFFAYLIYQSIREIRMRKFALKGSACSVKVWPLLYFSQRLSKVKQCVSALDQVSLMTHQVSLVTCTPFRMISGCAIWRPGTQKFG